MKPTLTTIVVACALFSVAGTAEAGRVLFDPWQVGLQAATLHWGGDPPCGHPSFVHHDRTNPGAYMWVTGDIDQPGTMPCVIHVSDDGERLNPGDICADVVHETGHLFGLRHTDDPADVMFAGGAQWRAAWECRRMMHRQRYARTCTRRDGCRWVYAWTRSAWPLAANPSTG